MSLNDILEMLLELMNKTETSVYRETCVKDSYSIYYDMSKLLNKVDVEYTQLKEGLRKTINWHQGIEYENFCE